MSYQGISGWGRDGWWYVGQGASVVRTSYSRSFPNRYNPNVYYIYNNGQFVRTVATPPGTREVLIEDTLAAFAQVLQLMFQLNQLQGAQAAQAAYQSTQAQNQNLLHIGAAGMVGGGMGYSTANTNLVTTDSLAAAAFINRGGPQAALMAGLYASAGLPIPRSF